MFAQANSEHCRHKIFNGEWTIDGEPQDISLFNMIRNTEKLNHAGTIVAYSDNSAIMAGGEAERWFPRGMSEQYGRHVELTHTLMKVETHNHPTAISPFAGAATGSGGEIATKARPGAARGPRRAWRASRYRISICPVRASRGKTPAMQRRRCRSAIPPTPMSPTDVRTALHRPCRS